MNYLKRLLSAFVFVLLSFYGISQNITAAEYFWDADPGAGLGTPLTPVDGSYGEAIEEAFKNISILPSNGSHSFNVRFRDGNNIWSKLYSTSIFVDNDTTTRLFDIIEAEYFWDTDPGQGAGTPMIAFDGNLNEVIEDAYRNISILPAVGNHSFNVRIKDRDNNWGPLYSSSIYIDHANSSIRDIDVIAGELFFDTDPGQGSGMPLLALDGNFNSAIEDIFAQGLPTQITSGLHAMHVRIKGEDNQWGPTYVTTVHIDTTIYGLEAKIIEGDTLLCDNADLTNNLFIAQTNPLASYNWSVNNGSVSSGQGNDSVYINWNGTFPASLQLILCEGVTCDTVQYTINTKAASYTSLYDSICQGNTYDFNGTILNTSGIYYDTLSNSIGCDSIVNLNFYVKPLPTLVITQTGNTLIATSGFATYQWYFNGNLISGAISSSYTTNTSGTYAVEANTNLGCYAVSGGYTYIGCTNTNYSFKDTICQGDSILFLGNHYNSTGNYVDTIYNVAGCDSIITLQLQVNVCTPLVRDSCSGLFISEYIEGSGNNKAIEIYNGSSNNIDLSLYEIKKYTNGATTGTSISLLGMLSPYNTYVIANPSANPSIISAANILTGSVNFTGNDAISIERNDTLIDLIGVIGDNPPGGQWGNGTQDHTLVRKSSIAGGVKTNPTLFDPATEWDIYTIDISTYLGYHSGPCNTTNIGHESGFKFNVYPNPSYGNFTIEHNFDGNVTIDIIDMKGRLIKSIIETGGKTHIKLLNVESGIYLIKITDKNQELLYFNRVVVSKIIGN